MKSKPIMCIDTGIIYKSLIEDSEETGIGFTGISKVCL